MLSPDFEPSSFSYNKTLEDITNMLSEKDKKILRWFEFGSDVNNLSIHFYTGAIKSKNNFISQYFAFDRCLRNVQVKFLTKQSKGEISNYYVGDINSEFEEVSRLSQILEIKNIIDREKELDKLRWDKISSIVTFDYFNLNTILAFLAKGQIVERWNKLDKNEGAILFKQLVEDVRGTFKGVEFK
jgi:hypothetical protein